jgi:DNA repair protein RecO (recombination protein O)
MIEKSPGIMLRTIPYSESSVIARVYTRSDGLQSFIMSGTRKRGGRGQAALFQPLTIVDLVYYRKAHKGLMRIRELACGYPYRTVPYRVEKSAIAIFIAELLSLTVKEGEPDGELYDFLEKSFHVLDEQERGIEPFHLLFMIRLTRFLGIYPNRDAYRTGARFSLSHGMYDMETRDHDIQLSAAHTAILFELQQATYDSLESLSLAREDRTALLDAMVLYYEIQLRQDMKMKSHKVLHEAFG